MFQVDVLVLLWAKGTRASSQYIGKISFLSNEVVKEENLSSFHVYRSNWEMSTGHILLPSSLAVKSVRDRPAYYAERLYKSMKGLGTDEHTLTRVMVSRSEIDMVQIKQRFQELYGKTLASFIKVRGQYDKHKKMV